MAHDRERGQDGQAEHDRRARVEERVSVVVRDQVHAQREDEERHGAEGCEQPELQLQALTTGRRAEAHHEREQGERRDDDERQERGHLDPVRQDPGGIRDLVALQLALGQGLLDGRERDDRDRRRHQRAEARRGRLPVGEELQQQHVERRECGADHPVRDPGEPASAVDPLGEHPLGDVRQHDLQACRGGEIEQEPRHRIARLARHDEHGERPVPEHDHDLDEREPVRRGPGVDVLPRLQHERGEQEDGRRARQCPIASRSRKLRTAPMVGPRASRPQGTSVLARAAQAAVTGWTLRWDSS